MLKSLIQGAAILSALFLLVACGASKKVHEERLMLQGVDSFENSVITLPEPRIQKGDLLTIMVFSDNKEATEIFNQPQSGGGSGGNISAGNLASSGRGYLVDNRGQIYLHMLGETKVEGFTKKELADTLQRLLSPYLRNPYVTVRYTNARITILGEVGKPGVIEMPDQRITIFDAIGMVGDLTQFSRRDNILVVREIYGKRSVERLDLRKADVYKSPVFYLQQNDLVYVEPTRRKPTGNDQVFMRNMAVTTSVLSFITFFITILTR